MKAEQERRKQRYEIRWKERGRHEEEMRTDEERSRGGKEMRANKDRMMDRVERRLMV